MNDLRVKTHGIQRFAQLTEDVHLLLPILEAAEQTLERRVADLNNGYADMDHDCLVHTRNLIRALLLEDTREYERVMDIYRHALV